MHAFLCIPSSEAMHVFTAEMKSGDTQCLSFVHVCNQDTCMILLKFLFITSFFSYGMSSECVFPSTCKLLSLLYHARVLA